MCIKYLDRPKNTKKITNIEIRNLLKRFIDTDKCYIKMFDSKYKVAPKQEYKRFIKRSTVDLRKYIPEYGDCDDYAIALYGEFSKYKYWNALVFGQVSVETGKNSRHALNIFIDNDYNVWYVEPQNDKIWNIIDEKNYKPYFIQF